MRIIVAAVVCVVSFPMLGVSAAHAATPAPKVGACYAYAWKSLAAANGPSKTVSCSRTHTAVTYYVGTFAGAAAAGTTPVSPAAFADSGSGCWGALVRKLGVKVVALTRVRMGFFVPTRAQWNAGARWYRCDAVLATSNSAIAPIPKDFLRSVRQPSGVAAYRRCLTAKGALVACASGKARYAARKYATLGTKSALYPGDSGVADTSMGRCNRALGTAFMYATWPLADGWGLGQRQTTCYSRR